MKTTDSKFISSFSLLMLATYIFLLTSCNTTEPPSNPKLTLVAEDASCTEVWLNIKTENISLPTAITLKQNDSTFFVSYIATDDTTLYIESLLPNQTYTFQTIIQSNNHSSNRVTVTTMDTTSHNFTWETFTFGGVNGGSVLQDVAIINENDIWAVGEIHTAETDRFDSNGVWVKPYNAVHWDGNKWELKRVLVDYRGNEIFLSLESIFAFSSSDIWLVSSLPIHGDGKNWEIFDVRELTNSDLSLTNAWGSSSEDIYFVGRSGSIAHYNGSRWEKIESGTDKNIYDVYGDYNHRTNKYEIIAVASNLLTNIKELDILAIEGNIATKINSAPIAQPLQSLWFKPNTKYYLVGSGIYLKNRLNEKGWERLSRDISIYFKNAIAAEAINDIVVAGAFNEVLHFNGVSWKSYRGIELPNTESRLLNISYKKNIVCIVGQNERKGILHLGKK